MKSAIGKWSKCAVAGLAVGIVSCASGSVQAGQGGWATAGKILTGFVAADILFNHCAPAPQPVVYVAPPPTPVYIAAPAPVYYAVPAAPVVYAAPQPVYVVPQPVYYAAPAPAVIYCRPMYYPAPVCRVSIGVSYGGHYGGGHHRR